MTTDPTTTWTTTLTTGTTTLMTIEVRRPMPHPDPAVAPWWRRALSTARTRIICWVLLLVLGALAVLTLVTWRLLVQATDARMDQALLSRVWGYDFDRGSNVVDVYVRYLRRKLGAERIATVRGMSYRLDAVG